VARTLVGEDCTIGVSCHSEAEVDRAGRNGADYVFFGNVFATRSHPEHPPLGVPALHHVATGLAGSLPGSDQAGHRRLPVIAIGGIVPPFVGEILDAGAHGVAVLSGVWADPDPGLAVSEYISALARPSAIADR
jgi:thiazole tautomerase (transcriptional regulator TenI)